MTSGAGRGRRKGGREGRRPAPPRRSRRRGAGDLDPAAAREGLRIPANRLRWVCPPRGIPEAEAESIDATVGQDRALEALRLGLEIRAPGYNVFVCGLTGTGRTTTVLQMVKRLAPSCPVPKDRAFVHNFTDPNRPRLLTLQAGRASALRRDLEELIALLRRTLPASVEDREFHRRRDGILERYAAREKVLFDAFRERLAADGFALVEIAGERMKRLEVFPVHGKEPVPMDRFRALVEEGTIPREKLEEKEPRFLEHRRELAQVLRRHREMAREMNAEVVASLKEAVKGSLTGAFEDLRARYTEERVRRFLDGIEEDVLDHIVPLAREAGQQGGGEGADDDPRDGRFHLYEVHVLVDRRGLQGCPVVVETAPSVAGMVGNIERRPVAPGVFVADHTMIRPGSLLEADGGFLILALEDVLADPAAWIHLRRVLKHRRLEIRATEIPAGLGGIGLAPEAIDIDVKVVLVGDWRLYELLYRGDRDFAETFRVKADFEPDMDASARNVRHFSRVAAKIGREADLPPLTRDGFAALAEYGVRASGRQGKISTRFSDVADLLREAGYWASLDGAKRISGDHVRRAAERRDRRNGLAEARIQDLIEKEVLLIDTDGRRVGRVNGLSVYDLGYYAFGKPTVITASTGVGQAGIINVEREARLSGGIYDKGVLIIAGYFRRTFAQHRPLSLTASVCFEQSYSGVDGDSASVAEVGALLSELSGIPVDQGVAVTGSLNQHGWVQPIGGVNEKVEGFFRVCAARGLTGRQGVVIPRANVGELMLSEEVAEACRKGEFSVWSVTRVEEAVALLLDAVPGTCDHEGCWSEGSVYRRADDRLKEYAAKLGAAEDWRLVPGTGGPSSPPPEAPPRPPLPPDRPPRPGRARTRR